jgi:hypothetical protein
MKPTLLSSMPDLLHSGETFGASSEFLGDDADAYKTFLKAGR